jgi:hypothetical protein
LNALRQIIKIQGFIVFLRNNRVLVRHDIRILTQRNNRILTQHDYRIIEQTWQRPAKN